MSRQIPMIDGLPKLNPEVKAAWIAALRSGDYVQGPNALRQHMPNFDTMCCLGVLCELHSKTPKGFEWKKVDSVYYTYDGVMSYPTEEVLFWAGLETEHLRTTLTAQEELNKKLMLDPSSTGMVGYALASLNDNLGYTFSEIADFIEKNM